MGRMRGSTFNSLYKLKGPRMRASLFNSLRKLKGPVACATGPFPTALLFLRFEIVSR
jgi:hypothetical protein